MEGGVLFLSVASFVTTGIVVIPKSSLLPLFDPVKAPFSTCSNTSSSCSPTKIDIIAGGASFAPKRWSFHALAAEYLSKSACSFTAFITALKNNKNCLLSCGVSVGSNKFIPSSVAIDQLLCFPDPFTPANGFS